MSDETVNTGYITTSAGRKREVCLVGGYIYHKNKVKGELTYWHCKEKQTQNKCNVKIQTKNNKIYLNNFVEHNHQPPPPPQVETD